MEWSCSVGRAWGERVGLAQDVIERGLRSGSRGLWVRRERMLPCRTCALDTTVYSRLFSPCKIFATTPIFLWCESWLDLISPTCRYHILYNYRGREDIFLSIHVLGEMFPLQNNPLYGVILLWLWPLPCVVTNLGLTIGSLQTLLGPEKTC